MTVDGSIGQRLVPCFVIAFEHHAVFQGFGPVSPSADHQATIDPRILRFGFDREIHGLPVTAQECETANCRRTSPQNFSLAGSE